MRKGGKLLGALLAFTMIFSGTIGIGMTARADICGGLEEKDIYTPEAEDVIQDPVLHWTIRSSMNAVTSRPVLTKEMVGDKMVSYISFEQNRHPEDFEGWKKQYWIEDLEGIQYAKSAKMINICYTSVVGKKIKSVEPVSELTQLQTLLLKENGITDISSLSTLTNLQEFDVAGNEIEDMASVAGMTKLKKLNVASNKITDISSVSGLDKLENLDISNNKVTTLPDMKNLGNVTYLNASDNRLTDISELSNLKHLQELDLSGNDGITDVRPLAGLIYLDKDKTFLPDNSVKEDLFAAIDVNVLFNKFNISTMQESQLDDVKKALDAYEALTDEQKTYISDKRIAAAKDNYDKVSKGEEPTYYPEYDEGGDRLPNFDRIEILVLDKYGQPMPNIEFTKRRESAYTFDEESVTTNASGKLVLQHKATDVFYDEILVYPKGDTYVANPDRISYAVLNKATDLINGKKATGLEDLKITLIPTTEYVDKAELEKAISDAGSITEEYKYTKDSWSRFEEACARAQEVFADVDATEQEVNDSQNVLIAAQKGLQKKEVLTALKLVVEDSNGNVFTRPFKFQMRVPQTGAEAWNEWSDKYTSTAYITASPAWEDGKEWEIVACNHEAYAMDSIYVTVGVTEDGTRYFKTVDGQPVGVDFEKKVTVRKIAQALDSANEIAPDGSLLKEYVEEAKLYDSSDYTPKTYQALTDAIAEAETVLEKGDVIQEDYNAAAAKLKSAEAGLALLSDKTALEMEINLEFGLTKSEYTEDSWSSYEAALASAKQVNDNVNATAEEIENARKTLEEARLALQKKETKPNPDPKPEPEPSGKVLTDATTFRARVQDEAGNPVSGVTFTIIGEEDPSCAYERQTNDSGVLEFAPTPSWDYALTFNVSIKSASAETTPAKASFITDYEGKIVSVNGETLPTEEEIIFTVKSKETPEPDPEPGDKVLSDATTFRARVQDEAGNPLSDIKFFFDGVEDACKYAISSDGNGILSYSPNAGDYDLQFTVSIHEGRYEVTPEKVTFVTDAKSDIVSINGKELPTDEEIIFVVKTGEEPKPEVDKTALKRAIDQAKALEKGNYTDDSWNALQEAITSAEEVFADEQATEEMVSVQKAALEAAIAELKEKEVEPVNPDKPNPDEPNPGKPGADKPNPGKPGADKPDPGKPGADKPDPGKPGADMQKQSTPEPNKAPQTGDVAQPFAYVFVMLAAVGAGVTVLRRRRKGIDV